MRRILATGALALALATSGCAFATRDPGVDFGPAGYGPGVPCPGSGTNIAGGDWQPGQYCLPGGR